MFGIRAKALVLVAPLLLTTACGGGSQGNSSSGSGGNKTQVTLQLQWIVQAQFAGYLAAQAKGFYDAEGLNVTVRPGGPDVQGDQVVAAGGADFGIQPFGVVLAGRDAGINLVTIAQMFERTGLRLVSWKSDGITSPEQFKGKKIGLWSGSLPPYATFNKYGIDPRKDVTIVSQGFDMSLLLQHKIDLASAQVYNEYAQLLAAGHEPTEFNLINYDALGTSVIEDGVMTRAKWLADPKHQDIAVRFLRASMKGWIYCRDHVDDCVSIVLKAGTNLPPKLMKWQMNEVNKLIWPSTGGIGEMTPDLAQRTADTLLNFGVIKKPADLSAAYTNQYRDMAASGFSQDDLKGASFHPLQLTAKDVKP